jgi:uncharacterized repeat protein (TIGR01451 family)
LVNGPTHGTLTLNADGSFSYIPATNYTGPDSFSYRASDGTTNSGIATVSLTVTPVNDAPVAVNDTYSTTEDTPLSVSAPGILANDTDADTNTLTAALVSGPTHGTLTLNADGSFSYTPATNYTGPDSFSYQANDGTTNSGITTVSLTVTPVNDAPVAVNDTYTTTEDTPLSVSAPGILANDTDADTNTLTTALMSGPTHGTLTLNADGSFTYTPAANYNGTDGFTYRANDGQTNSGIATVNLNITPVNDPPLALNDSTNTVEDTAVIINVLANDTDPEGSPLSINGATTTNGTVTVAGTNLVFTPATNFIGTITLGYTVSDGTNTASANVTVRVTPLADLAVFKAGPANVMPGERFAYRITVTNRGPSAATNIFVIDNLPTNVTFVSASGGGVFSSNTVTWPAVASLSEGGAMNFTITVTAPTNGTFVNVASASSGTPDPNLSNNDGTSTGSSVTTSATPMQFGIQQGASVFNPQTGLFEQRVTVTNIGAFTASAVRLLVGGLRSGVSLYNATGTNIDRRPYVQYNAPLNPGQTVRLTLEFYVPDRRPFTNSVEAQAVLPTLSSSNPGSGVIIDRVFVDSRIPGEPRYVIEFGSIPGRTYTIIYSDDGLTSWQAATPAITATANRTQWYDDGPPKTVSKPSSNSNRFYRVILAPNP